MVETGSGVDDYGARALDSEKLGKMESRDLPSTSSEGKCLRTTPSEASVGQMLRPLFLVLAFVGHYRFTDKTTILLNLPSFLVLIIAWMDFIRLFFIYKTDVTYIMTVALFHIITASIAITSAQSYVYFSTQFKSVTEAWDAYRQQYPHADISRRRYVQKILALYFMFVLATLIFDLVAYILLPDLCKLVLSPFLTCGYPPWMCVLCAFASALKIAVYYGPIAAHSIVCCMLGAEFEAIRSSLQTNIDEFQESISEWMEPIRKRHLTLCMLIHHTDAVISPILLCACALDIPIVVLHVFAMVGDASSELDDGMSSIWRTTLVPYSCIIAILHLLLLTLCCAYVTHKGKSLALHLYDIQMRKVDQATKQSILACLHYLNYEHIGFTAWRVIDMDNRAMITIFSIVVSYICVMVHFAMVASGAEGSADIETLLDNTTQLYLPDDLD